MTFNNSKKAETSTLQLIITVIVILAVAGITLGIFRNQIGLQLPAFLGGVQDCETSLRGSCVAMPAECAQGASIQKGFNCKADKPLCCSAPSKNQCSGTTWNQCDSCQVSVTAVSFASTPVLNKPISVTCTYSATTPPCAEASYYKQGNPGSPTACVLDASKSRGLTAVFNCPAISITDKYEFSCGMKKTGTSGVPADKTCCAAPDYRPATQEIDVK